MVLQEKFSIDKEKAGSIAHIAHGSYTKAVEMVLSSDDARDQHELFVKMMRTSVSGNIKAIKAIANEIAGIGREMQKSFLLYALRMFREYFINNLGEPEMVYMTSEEWEFGERFSPYINERNIEEFTSEFSLAHRQVEQNGNAKIIFLDLCLKSTLLLRK